MYYYSQMPKPPKGPPPSFTPKKSSGSKLKLGPGPSPMAVDPGSIRFCLYKFTYIWLRDGRGFWTFLMYVGPRSVSGFRWQRNRWVFFGTDLRNIDSFFCK
ncbi:hypothetical protein [Alkalithermobacter paradoxus]|uniref:Transporter n=1 Tax=Alkalithermobacter paradoxus TaxID=29349 RepID=A0A1V4I814_9FIRM|nr:hypothetical protein CLOTH_09330 [[Clostridium] thermoalcaliphilum]